MYCGKCGAEWKKGAKVCAQCGNPVEQYNSTDREDIGGNIHDESCF